MAKFEIWREGFSTVGSSGTAHLFGIADGVNFHEACKAFFRQKRGHHNLYNAEKNRYWGCRLFDNEADARKSFG